MKSLGISLLDNGLVIGWTHHKVLVLEGSLVTECFYCKLRYRKGLLYPALRHRVSHDNAPLLSALVITYLGMRVLPKCSGVGCSVQVWDGDFFGKAESSESAAYPAGLSKGCLALVQPKFF
jgi:hypothetical protein